MVGMTAVRLGLAGLIVAAAVSNGNAARTPCPGGTFEVQGGPLLVGAPPSQVDTVTIAPDPASIELSLGCGPANVVKPDKVRGAKRGTKVRATWEACAALEGKIRLRGIIVDDCGRLTGKLRAKGVKRTFEALLPGSGACNPLAAPGAQGCAVGEKCTWVVVQDTPVPIGTTTCVADGTQDLGDPCTQGPAGETTGFDDCKAGLICIGGECQDVCGFDGSASAACAAGYNCTRYSGLFANGEDDPVAGACSEGCNPVTQEVTGGGPCPVGQGCYLLTSSTETIAVCAGAGSIGHGQEIVGTAFANSCLPGHQPRRRDEVTQVLECGALCQVTDVYLGTNEADEGGVSPYTCAAAGAAAPDDPSAGESCRYWWAREPFESPSPYSNTVGWCFKHAAFQYDTNGDLVSDAPFPRCITLTTGDLVPPIGNPPHNDAEYFWCVALPDPPALQLNRVGGGR
jgi:hypothetical protein